DPVPAGVRAPPSGTSEIYIAPGVRHFAGSLIRERWPKTGAVWIVSDDHVDATHGADVAAILGASGLHVHRLVVPPGETSKSIAGAERLYDQMLERRIERSDLV